MVNYVARKIKGLVMLSIEKDVLMNLDYQNLLHNFKKNKF